MKKLYSDLNNFLNRNISIFLFCLLLLNLDKIIKILNALVYKNDIYDSQGIGVIISTLLTIATVFLASIAFNASQKANEISLLALESERPEISMKIESSNDTGNIKKIISLVLINNEKIEAVNIHILYKPYKENIKLVLENGYLSKGLSRKIDLMEDGGKGSFIVFYSNPLTGKIYLSGYQFSSIGCKLEQLSEDENLITYSKFIEIYKIANKPNIKIENLIQMV